MQAPFPSSHRLRVLVVTRLYPNQAEPLACAFNRQQLSELGKLAEVEVLGVLPWLPWASTLAPSSRPGRLALLPPLEEFEGQRLRHAWAPYIPRGGPLLAPLNAPLYLHSLLPCLREHRGRFDVVLGSFLYPDAWAARAYAKLLGVPYAVKAHGTDVHVVGSWGSVRPLLRSTLAGAGAAVGVSLPMLQRLRALGASLERSVLVPNGVDPSLFAPGERNQARRELGLPAEADVLVFVGRLCLQKGLGELLEALPRLEARARERPLQLVFVGEGDLQSRLEREAADRRRRQSPLALRVVGPKPLGEVARHLRASDGLILPSWAEGTPNVVLEALASRRPVYASRVGGIPDVVTEGRTGLLFPPRDPCALAETLDRGLRLPWPAEDFEGRTPPTWSESASALHRALRAAASGAALAGSSPELAARC